MKFIRNIFVLINIIFAFALILAYLSYHISPQAIWFLAFFGLVYPYILLINVFFSIYWILRKKKAFLISLVVILIGFSHVKSTAMIFRFGEKKAGKDSDIKICSYNVRLFNHYKWDNTKSVHDSITKFINSEEADIICFQEFFYLKKMTPRLSEIRSGLKATPYYHIDYFEHAKDICYGIATFSKYPIINRGDIHFENSLNSSIYTDIVVGQDTIRVYNNHLQSIKIQNEDVDFLGDLKFEYDEDQMRKARSLTNKLRYAYIERSKQVKRVSESVKNSPYPVIICGDFNDTPVSYAYQKMKGKLKDSFVESGFGVSSTYNGRTPSFRIDYIFYDSDFTSRNYKRKKINYSDHYPIFTEISFD